MAMIASGLATILQGLRRGPVGSGYLCPLVNGPAFFAATLMAGKAGGLPLIFGMTAIGGVFEAFISRIITRLRAIFPSEVTGTVVTMVGVEIIGISVPHFFGVDKAHPAPALKPTLVALVTFMSMVGFTVWGRGRGRLFAVLFGMLIGYAFAGLIGVLTPADIQQVIREPLFALPPFDRYGLAFDWALLLPFLIATLSSALKTMGDLTTCQKINDADWKRPEMGSISRGILACACGNIFSGLAGALGQSPSSSNIGLAIGTGAAARRIAYTNGGLLILLAFVPKLASVFVVMPTPIMGACLIFAVSFMIVAGIQILMSRMVDARKTFVIGTSIIFGLSVDIAPHLYADMPAGLRPLFSSSLSVAALSAILLNLVFRIGIARRQTLTLTPGTDSSATIFAFMERQGGAWGARREVIYNAMAAMNELLEAIAARAPEARTVTMETRFDEFNLDITARYAGPPLELPDTRPDRQALRTDPAAPARLAGFLARQYVDRVAVTTAGAESCVQLHLDH